MKHKLSLTKQGLDISNNFFVNYVYRGAIHNLSLTKQGLGNSNVIFM